MNISYFDHKAVTQKAVEASIKKLRQYRKHTLDVIANGDTTQSEYSLAHVKNPAVHDLLDALRVEFKNIKHLVLIGIGGSNLGTQAVHEVLDTGTVALHMLDTVSAHAIEGLLHRLGSVKSAKQIAICVISKSGNTTETLVNAGVLLDALEERFKQDIYKQTIFIGNPDTHFLKTGKRMGVKTIPMPEIVGGRYSVTTEVGLVPLALLGHDTDSYINGLLDASTPEFESLAAENAARLYQYLSKKFTHYNFFAFEPRLATLGAWYRQLFAESIGKETDRDGKPVAKGFVPTISTAVELHSVGQLYFSGFAGVYTDFVTFDDNASNFAIPKKGITKQFGKFDVQEIATAIYGGVMAAYQERELPYRSMIFEEDLAYDLGLFMGMRMLEVMYIAELLNLNAFDQPNVELYKTKTREILGL